jgi:hypothetical protein
LDHSWTKQDFPPTTTNMKKYGRIHVFRKYEYFHTLLFTHPSPAHFVHIFNYIYKIHICVIHIHSNYKPSSVPDTTKKNCNTRYHATNNWSGIEYLCD